jgi:hypothetical protein
VRPPNDGASRQNYSAAKAKRVGWPLKRFATGTRRSVGTMKEAVGSRSAFGIPKKAVAS